MVRLVAVTEANGVLDLVDDGLGGAAVDLVVLLAAALVKDLLGGGLGVVGCNATGNACELKMLVMEKDKWRYWMLWTHGQRRR